MIINALNSRLLSPFNKEAEVDLIAIPATAIPISGGVLFRQRGEQDSSVEISRVRAFSRRFTRATSPWKADKFEFTGLFSRRNAERPNLRADKKRLLPRRGTKHDIGAGVGGRGGGGVCVSGIQKRKSPARGIFRGDLAFYAFSAGGKKVSFIENKVLVAFYLPPDISIPTREK